MGEARRRKLKKRQAGEVIRVSYGRDQRGQRWWIESSDPAAQCKITETGQVWDPAWDRKQ